VQHDYSMPTLVVPRSRVKLAYRSTEWVYNLRFVPGGMPYGRYTGPFGSQVTYKISGNEILNGFICTVTKNRLCRKSPIKWRLEWLILSYTERQYAEHPLPPLLFLRHNALTLKNSTSGFRQGRFLRSAKTLRWAS
jgi:hypothetical protein